MTQLAESKSVSLISDAIDSHRPLIYIQTSEEQRVEYLLHAVLKSHFKDGAALFMWSITDGLVQDGHSAKNQPHSPIEVLDYVLGYAAPALFILKDFHEYMEAIPDFRRRLRDIY
jgi:hypothetical protein